MIYTEGTVLKLHMDFVYVSKDGFNSVMLISAVWNVCMCVLLLQSDGHWDFCRRNV